MKEKSQAKLEIEALAEVFGIATTGFEEYYKTCKEKTKGTDSTAASAGDNSTAASAGDNSGCTAIGYRAAVRGCLGNLLMASEYVIKDNKYIPVGGAACLVDGKKIKVGSDYIVEKGKWVEVDFTDDIFAYVISTKNGVKKVKTESGKVLFIVHDDKGNSAHGETIAKAYEDLVYKVVAQFHGDLPKKATGAEWIGIYRSITGACAAGVKNFVESTGKSLDDTYTGKQIAALVKGQYGAEQFSKKIMKFLATYIHTRIKGDYIRTVYADNPSESMSIAKKYCRKGYIVSKVVSA